MLWYCQGPKPPLPLAIQTQATKADVSPREHSIQPYLVLTWGSGLYGGGNSSGLFNGSIQVRGAEARGHGPQGGPWGAWPGLLRNKSN